MPKVSMKICLKQSFEIFSVECEGRYEEKKSELGLLLDCNVRNYQSDIKNFYLYYKIKMQT